MRYTSLSRRLERLASDRWARRAVRVLLRSAWIGLSLVCIGLGVSLLMGWSIPINYLLAGALGCVAIGALLLLNRPLRAHEVARRLDQRFGLNQQIATALEVGARGAPEGVETYLLEQAGVTTGQVQQYIARNRRRPWAEVVTLVAVALLCLGMLAFVSLRPPAETPAQERLPDLNPPQELANNPEVPPEQQQPQNNQAAGGQQQTQTQMSSGGAIDQQSASALADAMRDQSATRPAADALDRGNVAGASQSLRELADQADQLSDATRTDLANELRDAANMIEPNNPDMAQQIRESAAGLQQPGQSSAEALERLADAVDQLQESGQQQGQQAQQGQQPPNGQQQGQGNSGAGNAAVPSEQREQPFERLGQDGVPLELESQGDGQSPGEGDPDDATSTGSGSFQPGAGQAPESDEVDVADDPLRIPVELRDVVQEYFSPTE